MSREIGLDEVLLSNATVQAWHEVARRIADIAYDLGISSDKIPDERARIEEDGSLTIFVTLPIGEVSLQVSPRDWERRIAPN